MLSVEMRVLRANFGLGGDRYSTYPKAATIHTAKYLKTVSQLISTLFALLIFRICRQGHVQNADVYQTTMLPVHTLNSSIVQNSEGPYARTVANMPLQHPPLPFDQTQSYMPMRAISPTFSNEGDFNGETYATGPFECYGNHDSSGPQEEYLTGPSGVDRATGTGWSVSEETQLQTDASLPGYRIHTTPSNYDHSLDKSGHPATASHIYLGEDNPSAEADYGRETQRAPHWTDGFAAADEILSKGYSNTSLPSNAACYRFDPRYKSGHLATASHMHFCDDDPSAEAHYEREIQRAPHWTDGFAAADEVLSKGYPNMSLPSNAARQQFDPRYKYTGTCTEHQARASIPSEASLNPVDRIDPGLDPLISSSRSGQHGQSQAKHRSPNQRSLPFQKLFEPREKALRDIEHMIRTRGGIETLTPSADKRLRLHKDPWTSDGSKFASRNEESCEDNQGDSTS